MSDTTITQHFVTFYSPGTFVAETSTYPIDSWDIEAAKALSSQVVERYNAKPYGFRFSTRGRGDNDLDSKEIERSGLYFLGGKVETLAEIEARNDSSEHILVSNMRNNGWQKIITNTNSWKWTQPLEEGDIVLELFAD